MATLIKNGQEVTIGIEEVEYQFTDESIDTCDSPVQMVIIETNTANSAGSLQFAAGAETFSSQKTRSGGEKHYISIKNGTRNLKVKSTAAGQKFTPMI
jgi:hypothetical protein